MPSSGTGRLDPGRLRLIVVTDAGLAGPRGVERTVAAALEGGAPCIQLREKEAGTGDVLRLARRLRALTRAHGALLFLNDRLDVALAAEADGVHLGPDDLPVAETRRVVPDDFLVGYSTDDPLVARAAEAEGADYIGCGTVWPTSSKARAGRAIGPEGLARVARAVTIPVVGIGGITVERAGELAGTGAAGLAVIGAVMAAPDPAGAVKALLGAFGADPRESRV
jgi:thiamine-phosphate pyrophosphorylase